MRKDHVPAISGDEHDWVTGWRKLLCVFKNTTGLGKKVKRAMNKRTRQKVKQEIKNKMENGE